ncbi:MAG TPA: DUF4907 domain-containing protein, partial [Flavisolibacter sp.]|nr:DUF4907 domain-containing protein [Flavisolibacter sp.]
FFICIQGPGTKKLSYHLFRTSKGWGYNILVDTQIFIHQDVIPALQNDLAFKNSKQAEMAAIQVINKIKHHENPTFSSSEIQLVLRQNE